MNARHCMRCFGDLLATGISHAEILDDFLEFTKEDIKAYLESTADRERHLIDVASDS